MAEAREIKHSDGTLLGRLTPAVLDADGKILVRPHLDLTGIDGVIPFLTGAAAGVVRLTDGSMYDLTGDTIPVKLEHAGHLWHHAETMIAFKNGTTHECTDFCGPERV